MKAVVAVKWISNPVLSLCHTHTHTTILWLFGFVWDNPGELVPEETFTHSHPLWFIKYPSLLPPSTAIHGILPIQFTCFRVFFHNLSPSFLCSTSWPGTLHFILHTFLHSIIIFFLQHIQFSYSDTFQQSQLVNCSVRIYHLFNTI